MSGNYNTGGNWYYSDMESTLGAHTLRHWQLGVVQGHHWEEEVRKEGLVIGTSSQLWLQKKGDEESRKEKFGGERRGTSTVLCSVSY